MEHKRNHRLEFSDFTLYKVEIKNKTEICGNVANRNEHNVHSAHAEKVRKKISNKTPTNYNNSFHITIMYTDKTHNKKTRQIRVALHL